MKTGWQLLLYFLISATQQTILSKPDLRRQAAGLKTISITAGRVDFPFCIFRYERVTNLNQSKFWIDGTMAHGLQLAWKLT